MLVASTNLQRTPLSVVKKLNKMKEAPQSAVTIVEDTQFSSPSHRTCRTPRLYYTVTCIWAAFTGQTGWSITVLNMQPF